MILNQHKPQVESFGELSEGKFGVSEKDQVHILTILRDKLYSDKVMAVIREYSTNAVDAHVEAGIPDRPIKITSPTLLLPKFVVRDYGNGLSEEEIYNVYTQYGASTKRASNDAIGQLGLGCKSGFAYSNNFTITSFRNGTKSIYHAYIDETNVGKVSKMHEEATNEPSGIEISIAVDKDDFTQFRNKISMAVQYFDVKPDCNIEIYERQYSLKGDFWAVRDLSEKNLDYAKRNLLSKPTAIMGHIGYPIDLNAIGKLTPDQQAILGVPLEIKFDIGDLSISASRESLEYTDLTKSSIVDALDVILKSIEDIVKENFDKCTSPWEATLTYQKISQTLPNSYGYGYGRKSLASIVLPKFRYWMKAGKKYDLSRSSFNYDVEDGPMSVGYISPSNKTVSRSSYYRGVTIDKNLTIIINDTKSAWVKKAIALRGYLVKEKNITPRMLIVSFSKNADNPEKLLNDYLDKHSITGIDIYRLSDLPEEVETVVAATKGAGTVRSARVKGKVFVYNFERFSNKPSNSWDATEVDFKNDKGIYVVIDRFIPASGKISFAGLLNKLNRLGINTSRLKIYGFKKSEVDKINDKNWVKFEDYAESEIKKVLTPDLMKLQATRANFNLLRRISSDKIKEIFAKKNDFKNKDNPLLVFCEKFIEVQQKLYGINNVERERIRIIEESMAAGIIDNDQKPDFNFEIERSKMLDKYPMLKFSDLLYCGNRDKSWVDSVIDYCNKI